MSRLDAKICSRAEFRSRAFALPKPCVLTNGVFDILHRGHVSYLEEARKQGASLVVAVNTDSSVRGLGKGYGRPVNTCIDRIAVLAALESVSLVVEFNEDNASKIVEEALPSIYVKGGDYHDVDSTPEGIAVLGYGGRAILIPIIYNHSTTKILERVRKDTLISSM